MVLQSTANGEFHYVLLAAIISDGQQCQATLTSQTPSSTQTAAASIVEAESSIMSSMLSNQRAASRKCRG